VSNCYARLDETLVQCSVRYGKSNFDNELAMLNEKKNTALLKIDEEKKKRIGGADMLNQKKSSTSLKAEEDYKKKVTDRYNDDYKEIAKRYTTPNQNGFIFRQYEKNNIKIRCTFLNEKCVKIEYQNTDGMENDIKQLYPGIKEISISDVKQEYRPYIDINKVSFEPGNSFLYNLVSSFSGEGFYLFVFKGRIQVIGDKYYDSVINGKPQQPEPKPKSKEGL
jgi:hypothetical protein